MSRIETLRKLLAQSPDDTFLLYSLGMEHLSAGRLEQAMEQFRRVLALDGAYLAAYTQAAKALRAMGQRDQAIEMLRAGIAAATAAGDTHARDNMKTQLENQ